jgi:hypothetical protein
MSRVHAIGPKRTSLTSLKALLLTIVVGALLSAGYAGMIGVSHFLIHGRWDRTPVFALGCLACGAVFGLVVGALFFRSPETKKHA